MSQLVSHSHAVNAIRRILRPLVRLLLRYQVTYQALLPLLKQTYVEVAEQEFTLPDKAQTDSRISLLTGVHRKDVRKFREQDASLEGAPVSVSMGGQMVAYWLSAPGYQSKGHPVRLPLRSEGQTPSFEQLVQQVVHGDIRPRAVLDEWLALGVVKQDDDGLLCLQQEAFVPRSGEPELLFYLGRNVADHLQVASDNLTAAQPRIERSVCYAGLSEQAVDELHQLYRQQAGELLKHINQEALRLKQEQPGDQRINAGVFFTDDVAVANKSRSEPS
jgi:hypothetical protein